MIRLQNENRAVLATRALALLTAAQVPLTAEALCHALGIAQVLDDKKKNPSTLSLEEIPDLISIIECYGTHDQSRDACTLPHTPGDA